MVSRQMFNAHKVLRRIAPEFLSGSRNAASFLFDFI